MTYELENEYSSDRLTSKRFITSSPMNLNSIIELIKSYEDDYTVLYEASVSSYDADGTYGTMTYTTVEKLSKQFKYSNPDISIRAFYIDRETEKYKFHLDTSVNSSYFRIATEQRIALMVEEEIEEEKELKRQRENG